MQNVQIVQMSSGGILQIARDTIAGRIHAAATANMELVIADNPEAYDESEKLAMVLVEELKLSTGLDLFTLLFRGDLIKRIRDSGLHTKHPNTYTTLEEMAVANGMSVSELHNTIDLCETIFPYLVGTLNLDLATLWENIGKSNFREMISVLKALINGEVPSAASVRQSYTHALDNAAINNPEADEDQLHAAAVSNILSQGSTMTNSDLRQALRPGRVPSTQAFIANTQEDVSYVLVKMTQEQLSDLLRRTRGLLETQQASRSDLANLITGRQ